MGNFDAETQAFGLATTGGVVISTGVGGLTLGGAIAEVGEDETAIGFRSAPFLYQSNAVWEAEDAQRERHVGWARDFFAAMGPFSAGATYLNFIGEEGTDRIRSAFRPAVWDALLATKRRFDPGNVFRVNQNIAP